MDTNFDPSYSVLTKDPASSTELLLSATLKPAQNVCFLCKTPHFKIARHFNSHIKEDPDFEKALNLPVGSSQRRLMLKELRNQGNFIHNQRVISKGCGTLKVWRRTKSKNSNYEYCIHCKTMYSCRDLWRHMNEAKE